jgi:hypothetical protein
VTPLTPVDLLAAPELAAIDLLDHAVHVAGLALLAQYPHLLGDEYGRVPHDGDAVAELAERLLRRARALDRVIARYRRAVANAQRADSNDDLPFLTNQPPPCRHRSVRPPSTSVNG